MNHLYLWILLFGFLSGGYVCKWFNEAAEQALIYGTQRAWAVTLSILIILAHIAFFALSIAFLYRGIF